MKSNQKSVEKTVLIKSNSLIDFNKNVKLFLLINLILFFLLVLFKIQGSSTPIWNSFFGIDQKKSKDVLFGNPRGIRQDEWSTWVPNIINQCKTGMKVKNYDFGGGNVTHLYSFIPVEGFKDLLRPKLWGYHIFDIERGYSWDWNLRIFGLLVSAFLFFLIFTGNNFWLSVFGAFWLFLSSGQQWWSNNQGELMSYVFFIIVSLIMLLYSTSIKEILLWFVPLLIFCYSFALVMYPPWQIPIAYLMICVIVGFIISNWEKDKLFKEFPLKISAGFLITSILVGFVLWILNDAKDALEMTLNTSYPGKRIITGGDLLFNRLFSEYFGYFITDVKTPSLWLNICEASGYLVFFPIILYYIVQSVILKIKIDFTILFTTVFMMICILWMFVGLPQFLAKMIFFHVIPTYRLLPIFQISSVLLTVIYLSKKIDVKIKNIDVLLVGIISFTLIYLLSLNTNKSVDSFFKTSQLIVLTFFFTICYLLLAFPQFKYRNLSFGVLIILFLLPNIIVNPITKGLNAVTENPLIKQVRPIHDLTPEAKWVVFGNVLLANLLKVEGIQVFNGAKSPPILSEFKIFDPTGKDDFIYNRGGYNNLFSFIDGKDSTVFKLNENATVNDTYSMYADPCGAKMKKIGIKYVLFTYQPQAAEVRCMKLVSADVLPVYQILD